MTENKSEFFQLKHIPMELILFGLVIFSMGIGAYIFESVFNNFLHERYQITALQR